MSIPLVKSILSIVLLGQTAVAVFTMFKILGRGEKQIDTLRLRNIHRINGRIYVLIFIFIAYLCVRLVVSSGFELTGRAAIHSIFALAVTVLLVVKILILKVYRQFYNQVKALGILIAFLTIVMVGSSGGYYLLVTR